VAEEVGFEPTERSHVQRFSRPPHSTTLPPLRLIASVYLSARICASGVTGVLSDYLQSYL
jgi:hypothetical protein